MMRLTDRRSVGERMPVVQSRLARSALYSCESHRHAQYALVMLSVVAWATALGTAPLTAVGQVIIEGGRHPDNSAMYTWTLVNHGDKPITSFQIPHFRGMVFTPPEGWEFEMTHKVEFGSEQKPGIITARAPRGAALRPHHSAVFTLRIARELPNAPARRAATIGFADDTYQAIEGVEVPWRVPALRKYGLLFVLGIMFAAYLLVQVLRSRRRKLPEPGGRLGPSGEPAP